MALVLCGGYGCVLVYKLILVCFLGPLVSNFLAEQVKSAVAALLTGTFNVCFLPHTVCHVMLIFLTSVLSKPTGLGWLWGSAFPVLCLAPLKVPVGGVIDTTLQGSRPQLHTSFSMDCWRVGSQRGVWSLRILDGFCLVTQRQSHRPPSSWHLKIAQSGSLHQLCCL